MANSSKILRYALRNQKLISSKLGSDKLAIINSSLKTHFDGLVELSISSNDGRYDLITTECPDGGTVDFYVIGKTYNVVRLAFKQFNT